MTRQEVKTCYTLYVYNWRTCHNLLQTGEGDVVLFEQEMRQLCFLSKSTTTEKCDILRATDDLCCSVEHVKSWWIRLIHQDCAPFSLIMETNSRVAGNNIRFFLYDIIDNAAQESAQAFLPPCQMRCTCKQGCGNTSVEITLQCGGSTNALKKRNEKKKEFVAAAFKSDKENDGHCIRC